MPNLVNKLDKKNSTMKHCVKKRLNGSACSLLSIHIKKISNVKFLVRKKS